MFALMRLYFMSWWRSFVGPFFSFGFPIIIMVLLGQFTPFSYFAPTYLLYCGITLGVQSLSISLVQFKSSSIIKRIGQTPITRSGFIFSIFLFNFILILLATLWTLIVIWVAQALKIVKLDFIAKVPGILVGEFSTIDYIINAAIDFSKIQWGYVVILVFIGALFSVSLGLWIATICRTTEKANGLGLLIYFILNFLGGIFFPLTQIKKAKTLDLISSFIPVRPIAESMVWAFKDTFRWTKNYEITSKVVSGEVTEVVNFGPIWLWLLLPVATAIIFLGLAINNFTWE